MCDGAGIDALWVRDHLASARGPWLEAWTALTLASTVARRARLGATLNIAFRPPATLAAQAGTLDFATGGRLELCLSVGWIEREHIAFGFDFPDPETRLRRLEQYARIVSGLLAGESVAVTGSSEAGNAELGISSPQPGGPTLSIEAITSAQMEVAARIADDVSIPAGTVRDVREGLSMIRRACEAAERDPASLGIALELPVSIGRTDAEAKARADAEPLFELTGPPAEVGIFGTLEECQDRVIELAHAGVTDLRCILPNSPDVHDVIAQLTAMAIGTRDVLAPNAPRSKAPDPPESWGGRASRN
jgi:alkanesulfonate monooxygenase SsuD/methylene tetrahydromethanopterin reductase-like flavin-dependent oxidoreductase (luciferase family)